jgi:hypothetical protein
MGMKETRVVSNRRPAIKRTYTLKHVDCLIAELSAICQYAKETNSPGLVDLERALKRAYHLRILLNCKRTTSRQWISLFEAVVFVLEVSKKFYSFFINYIQKKVINHEFWNNNKIIAYC